MPEIISRKDAKAKGLKRYFTGKPCKHGHIAEKTTVNGSCVDCFKINQSANYASDIEESRKKGRERDAKIKQEQSERYASKRQKGKERAAQRRKDNPERAKELRQLSYIRNKSLFIRHAKIRKVRLRGAEGSHSQKEVDALYKAQKGKCIYCNKKLGNKYHEDHIIPLSKGGSNYISNIQLTCVSCNCSKKASDPYVYAQKLGRLF